MKTENFFKPVLVLNVHAGANLVECQIEASSLALELRCDVVFVFNDEKWRIDFLDLIKFRKVEDVPELLNA